MLFLPIQHSWQYVEFAGLEEEAEGDDHIQLPYPNADKANAHQGKSLEALLATKNKRILEELTKFRVCPVLVPISLGNSRSTPDFAH